MTSTSFSNWLHNQMLQRGWGPAEMSHKTGLASSTISRLASGMANPGLDALIKISNALAIPIDVAIKNAGFNLKVTRKNESVEFTQWESLFYQLDEGERQELLKIGNAYLVIRERLPLNGHHNK